jgi:hypothetical protein
LAHGSASLKESYNVFELPGPCGSTTVLGPCRTNSLKRLKAADPEVLRGVINRTFVQLVENCLGRGELLLGLNRTFIAPRILDTLAGALGYADSLTELI